MTSALDIAARNDAVNSFKLLVTKGREISYHESDIDECALITAARYGFIDGIEICTTRPINRYTIRNALIISAVAGFRDTYDKLAKLDTVEEFEHKIDFTQIARSNIKA